MAKGAGKPKGMPKGKMPMDKMHKGKMPMKDDMYNRGGKVGCKKGH